MKTMSNIIFTILLLLPPSLISCYSIAKPGCLDRCGSLPIPFPFGVGSNCSDGPSFNISCDASTDPPKPYLTIFRQHPDVVEIKGSQVRVTHPYLLTSFCYNASGEVPANDTWYGVTLTGTQYTLSEENWLTTIGCDDFVLGIGMEDETYGGGCQSYCKDSRDSGGRGFCPDNSNGYSAGTGCCRAPIPRGLPSLGAQLADVSARLGRERVFPCSYAFIQEKGNGNESEFSYPLSTLNDSTAFAKYDVLFGGWKVNKELVVRLDWRIGAENCSRARRNSTAFRCGENTVCRDFFDADIGGYLCECLPGYEGNPYLTGGCQDINECKDGRLYPCSKNAICDNTEGSATCLCKQGYSGDGLKSGTGCNPRSKVLIYMFIGLGSGNGFALLLAMCVVLRRIFKKRRIRNRKEMFCKRNSSLLLQQQTNEGIVGQTKLFSANELEIATDHFSESRILGTGGQGIVYKGMLSDGKIVAIKKSKVVNQNFLEHFINEVVILSQINHRNVIKLLGCCLETEVPLLVYEYLSNGTLFDLIHDPSTKCLVSWNMRLKIAADIAGALAYIHSASSVPIYHRDIKSKNFLLDEKYVVKLADFGMSRNVEVNQTHLTTMVKGTFGYFDPEYFQSRQYSEKSEVYSFGVVLAELLTGKRPVFRESEEEMATESLATFFRERIGKNRLQEILDPQVLSEYGRMEEATAVAKLAERCLNLKRIMRPTMKEVAVELESLRISTMPAPVEEGEEANVSEANPNIISNTQYTWETSYIGETSSFSNTYDHV